MQCSRWRSFRTLSHSPDTMVLCIFAKSGLPREKKHWSSNVSKWKMLLYDRMWNAYWNIFAVASVWVLEKRYWKDWKGFRSTRRFFGQSFTAPIIPHWLESRHLVACSLCPLRCFRSCIGYDILPWQQGGRPQRYSLGPSSCWSSRQEGEATKTIPLGCTHQMLSHGRPPRSTTWRAPVPLSARSHPGNGHCPKFLRIR